MRDRQHVFGAESHNLNADECPNRESASLGSRDSIIGLHSRVNIRIRTAVSDIFGSPRFYRSLYVQVVSSLPLQLLATL